jgi:proteasome assembly chaperone (PAC2) family protein
MWCMCKKTRLILLVGIILVSSYVFSCLLKTKSIAIAENRTTISKIKKERKIRRQQKEMKKRAKRIEKKLEKIRKRRNANRSKY